MKRYAAILAVLALAACQTAPAKTNANGTPVTQMEQVAGGLETTYAGLDTAYLAYLEAAPQSPSKAAVVAAVAPKRLAASAALRAFTRAAIAGAVSGEDVTAQTAIKALSDALLAAGIKLTDG